MSSIRGLLSDKPVAYYPSLARAIGSVSAALFLQQIAHWQGGKDRWVFRTQEELERETALTAKAQAVARKHLVNKNLLVEEHKGLPRRLYYKVDWENLEALLQSCQNATLDQPDGELCTTPMGDTTVESIDESIDSPKGADAPKEVKENPPAKAMLAMTVDRVRLRGFYPSPGQIANWGNGWSNYIYVAEGQEPPSADEQLDVLDTIVDAAAGKLGKTRFFLSVKDAVARAKNNVTDINSRRTDKITWIDGEKYINGILEA